MTEEQPMTCYCDYCQAEADCSDMTVIGVTFKDGIGKEQKEYWHLCPRCAAAFADCIDLCDTVNMEIIQEPWYQGGSE